MYQLLARQLPTCSQTPRSTLQMAVVLSKLAVASIWPSGAQQQDLTVLECISSNKTMHFQVLPSAVSCQMRTVLSPLQLASESPVGQEAV